MFAPIPNLAPAAAPIPAPAPQEDASFLSKVQAQPFTIILDDIPGPLSYDIATANPSPDVQLQTLKELRDASHGPAAQTIIHLFGAEAFNEPLGSARVQEIFTNYRMSLDEMGKMRDQMYQLADQLLQDPNLALPLQIWETVPPENRANVLDYIAYHYLELSLDNFFVRTDPEIDQEFFETLYGAYIPELNIVYLDGLSSSFDDLATALRLLIHEQRHFIDYRETNKFADTNEIVESFKAGEINFDEAMVYMRNKIGFERSDSRVAYFSDPLEQRAFVEEIFAGDALRDIGWNSPSVKPDFVYADFMTAFDQNVAPQPPIELEILPELHAA